MIIGDWNAKVGSQEMLGSQEMPGVTGKFGLGVQKETGQWLTEFSQENTLAMANTLFQHTREDSCFVNSSLVNITRWSNSKIRLIIIFAAKDGEALYGHQKRDQELTVAQIMNSLLPNSHIN